MARSVILAGAERCGGCQLPPRWCLCAALPPVITPLQVDVLIHRRENWRPTSTGRLIQRVVGGAKNHVYARTEPVARDQVAAAGRTLWILHPRGEPLSSPAPAEPEKIQVLLLDGNWSEAGHMLRTVGNWGRCVSLPMAGESRYWLRDQQDGGRFSTAEALLCLLSALGQHEAEKQFRLHFELHVYATLRARGRKEDAEKYLEGSPVKAALPEFLGRLTERRPNLTTARAELAVDVTSQPATGR